MSITAIILAAGTGSRMKSQVKKQYMKIQEKPVLFYSLCAFENSIVDHIVLVTGKDEVEYCRREIVEKYGFQKVSAVVAGGEQRYHSVYEGLKNCEREEFVMIHDGARPLVETELINRMADDLLVYPACVAGVLSKDTVKITDETGCVTETPDRRHVWIVQTPQCFRYGVIQKAYECMISKESEWKSRGVCITDDAMVCELFSDVPVKMVEASYRNIKITTPEDIEIVNKWLLTME